MPDCNTDQRHWVPQPTPARTDRRCNGGRISDAAIAEPCISTMGVIREFTPPQRIAPYGITVGPDNDLWFADDGGTIGRFAPN